MNPTNDMIEAQLDAEGKATKAEQKRAEKMRKVLSRLAKTSPRIALQLIVFGLSHTVLLRIADSPQHKKWERRGELG